MTNKLDSKFLFKNIVVVGLGLIGGSIARSCKKYGASEHVLGFDINKKQSEFALQNKIIDSIYDFGQSGDDDLIVICSSLFSYEDVLQKIKTNINDKTLIIDIGSLQNFPLEIAGNILGKKAKNFIACHPIAGSEKSGAQNSIADLFLDKKVIISPSKINDKNDIKKIESFWRKIGARPDFMDSKDHDKIFALVSHLPQYLSFLAYEDFKNGEDEILNKHFRLQNSNLKMWQEIFSLNSENIEHYLRFYVKNIDEIINSKFDCNKAEISLKENIILRRFFLVSCFLNLPNIEDFKNHSGSGFKDFIAIVDYKKFLLDNSQILTNNQESLIQFLEQVKSKILNNYK